MLDALAVILGLLALFVVGGISFNAIPNAIRTPFAAIEFDGSLATQGAGDLAYRALILGQKLAAGTAVANGLYKLTNADQAIALFGRGSQLHRMCIQWFRRNQSTEVWVGCLADNGAGVAATGTLTFTGPATAAGTLSLWLGGELIQVAVASGDTATAVATAVAAAINANLDLPVTSTSNLGVVTVTHRHKGTVGNEYDMRANYQDGEKFPAGIALAVVAMSAGATNPVLTTMIATLGDTWFHVIAHAWTDATSLAALEAELLRRDGPMVQRDGQMFSSANGSVSVLGTLGDSRNSRYGTIVAQCGENPLVPPHEFAAGLAAVVAYYSAIDQAAPLQTLELGFLQPAEGDLFTQSERNLLLYDGIGTTKPEAGGAVQIERLVTTWQTNATGAADTSYLDATTRFTLMFLRHTLRTELLTKFPRHKLADDGTRFGTGQKVVTPSIAKGVCLGWFRDMEERGLVEGYQQFKRDLVVVRNVANRNRLDFIVPPDLMNQLVVMAASMQFRV